MRKIIYSLVLAMLISTLALGAEVRKLGVNDLSYVDFTSPAGKAVKGIQPIDVRAYGAVGDGVTDDTAAIQAAIDAAYNNDGGTVLLPSGTYVISASINAKNSVSLIGTMGQPLIAGQTTKGIGTKIVWAGSDNGVMLNCYNALWFRMKGIHWDADSTAGVIGIKIDSDNIPSGSHNFLEEFVIKNAYIGIQWGTSGIAGGSYANQATIRRFLIDSTQTSSVGIQVNSGNAGQQGVIEDGDIQVDDLGIDIVVANLLEIRRVFGGKWQKTAFIRISIGIDIIIESCSSEGWGSRLYGGLNKISDDSYFLKVVPPGETYPVIQAVITTIHNRINNPITLGEAVRIVSIGDSFGVCYDSGGNVIPVTANGTSGVSSVVAINSGVPVATPYDYGWQDSAFVHLSMFDPGRASWRGVTFAAGDFTPVPAAGNAWTVDAGDVETYQYALHERTMTVSFKLNTTSVAGTPTGLSMKIPAAKVASVAMVNPILAVDNNVYSTGYCYVSAGIDTIICQKNDSSAWGTVANTNSLLGQITFEVN